METTTELLVDAGGERLDRYISGHLPDLSRAAVQRLIEEGNIHVDSRERKASYRVQTGEAITVRISPPEPVAARAEAIPLDIVYEDDNVIVVDKPAGMVVHPAAGHSAGTLVNALLAHTPSLNVGGEERPGVVHRLDSETSGLIIVAKNDAAMRNLQAQFKARRVHKTYLALVEGRITPPRGRIEAPIGRDLKHRQRMAVVTASNAKSRQAVTNYRTIANLREYTLVEAEPQTGRTHQIRVHFAFMGFPVVGDAIYGTRKKNRLGLERQFLHAWKLALTLPDGRAVSFTAPLPVDLRTVLLQLEFN
ncbi:MAG TPA: RluA family pseudouridine synthase, partial [Anaerolineae bacterium]